METLRQLLPSPSNLIVFEAAARCGSFTGAGVELGMSQAAVSFAIRKLEEDLGAQLFLREHRRVTLTDAGSRFFNDVAMGLGQIRRSITQIKSRARDRHVTISASTAFASYWMLPRLDRFRAELTGIDLRFETSDRDTDIIAENIPLAIRRGNAPFRGCESALLADEILVALASPRYLDRAGRPANAADLAKHQLIHLEEPYRPCPAWPDWFAAAGVTYPSRAQGLLMNDYALVVQAMVEGQGIALGWRHLTDRLVASGTLVKADPCELVADAGYHVLWPRDLPLSEEAAKVRDWLLAERGPFAA
jgi:DNA-binding transcriptional LysR family regulator